MEMVWGKWGWRVVVEDKEGDSERQSDTEEHRGKLRQGGHSGTCGYPYPTLASKAPTHQTAEVRPFEPGGGETQGHVKGAFSHLSLKSGWGACGG